ncbi:unnamed protein product [Prorocentrum cordatum]|uniref:Uncharacterized protein n=1 Tax=Prorocentrum cordatum TaxID=2364126 RepID=A0ABN9V5Z0_9DINO|nr:unnamed protein product [Polarella glacialis]
MPLSPDDLQAIGTLVHSMDHKLDGSVAEPKNLDDEFESSLAGFQLTNTRMREEFDWFAWNISGDPAAALLPGDDQMIAWPAPLPLFPPRSSSRPPSSTPG